MTLIDVGDIQLDYERSGNAGGPPLLLIMGMSGTALHWGEPFLDLLRADFDTIAYDHHGVGASTPLEGPITTREMADDAAGLLGALGLDDAHVLGISMGGMIAQELALNHPERVRTLTLGCTYCGGEGSALASEADLAGLVEAMGSGDRERALRAGWEINVSPQLAADEDAYATFREIAMRRAVALPVIMQQMQACAAHDTNARLGRSGAAHARHARHRRPSAARAERAADRLAHPRRAPGDLRRRRPPVLLGAPRALGRARARARRRCRLT